MAYADDFRVVSENTLAVLDSVLGKAVEQLGEESADALLMARLADDMFPLAAQIRVACDQVSSGLKRLSDSTFVLPDDDDATIAAARNRIARTRGALAAQDPSSFAAAGDQVAFALPMGISFAMTAEEYARDWAIAQLYFHVIAAYAILRSNGIAIGKQDYLAHMFRHVQAPAVG